MAKKRNVLFVLHQLTHGGVQHSIIKLLDRIDYEKNDVTLLVLCDRLDLLERVNKNVKILICKDTHNYEKHPLSLVLSVMGRVCDALGAKKAYRYFRKQEALFVYGKRYKYINENYIKDLPQYDVAVSYIHGYPSIVTAQYVNAKKKIMFYHASQDEVRWVHEKTLSHYDEIIAINNKVAQLLRGLYPNEKEKINTVDIYVDYKEIRAWAENDKATLSDKLNLVSCGRICHDKGYELAVKAAEILAQKGIDFHWYFVGGGPLRKEIEQQIAKAGLEKNITITGFLSNPFSYIGACDIYVQTSYFESHCMTIEEAKILCRPVVSTKTLGGCHLIEDGVSGLLADMDGHDLADKIERLINDTQLREGIIKNLEAVDHSLEEENYKKAIEQMLSR